MKIAITFQPVLGRNRFCTLGPVKRLILIQRTSNDLPNKMVYLKCTSWMCRETFPPMKMTKQRVQSTGTVFPFRFISIEIIKSLSSNWFHLLVPCFGFCFSLLFFFFFGSFVLWRIDENWKFPPFVPLPKCCTETRIVSAESCTTCTRYLCPVFYAFQYFWQGISIQVASRLVGK